MALDRELRFAKRLAREAREILIPYEEKPGRLDSMIKKDDSVVTRADIKVKDHIVEEVRKEFPDYGLIVEERDQGARQNRRYEYIWVWDPLDGSRAFESLFGVKKGKAKKKKGPKIDIAYGPIGGLLKKFGRDHYEPVLGVTLNIPRGEMLFAVRDEGAYVQKEGSGSYRINARARRNFTLDLVTSSSRMTEELEGIIEVLEPNSMRPMTSSLKALEIIRGRATLYVCHNTSPTHIWDLVGIDAIFREYGAVFTDVYGDEFEYWNLVKNAMNHNGILAGTKEAHESAHKNLESSEILG